MSRKSCPAESPGRHERAASMLEPAVTASNTMSAPRTASAWSRATPTPSSAALSLSLPASNSRSKARISTRCPASSPFETVCPTSPKPMNAILSMSVERSVHVLQALLLERLAHAVDVEGKLAFLQARPVRGFLLLALLARFCHFGGVEPRHHHHSVVVRDDHVAGLHLHTGAHHRHVHRADARLHRALLGDRARVAAADVEHHRLRAARLAGGREQLAEVAVLVRAGARDHQHVARLDRLHRDVDHPV